MSRRGENIRKRKDGRWEGRYSYQVGDKKKTKSVYAKTYLEAKRKLVEAKAATKQSNYSEVSMHTKFSFGACANMWLDLISKNRKPATYVKYHAIYEKYLKLLDDEPIFHINKEKIKTTVFEKNNIDSDSTKKTIIMITNQIIKYCNEMNHCDLELLPAKVIPKKRSIEIFNLQEQQRLLDYLNKNQDPYSIGIIICLSTGLRLGEICSLKWSDIDFENEIIRISSTVQRLPVEGHETKTILYEGLPKSECSIRDIPIPKELSLLIKEISIRGTYLIAGDKPVEPRTYEKKLASYIKKAGNIEKKNFHALRHTFATNCIESGMDVKCLSEILGHSDVHTTLNKYVHPTTEAKRSHLQRLVSFYGAAMGQLSDKAI